MASFEINEWAIGMDLNWVVAKFRQIKMEMRFEV